MMVYDSIFLREVSDVNKMKMLTDYISGLPDEIKEGEAMNRIKDCIKSGDKIMIIDSYHGLTKLQQQIIVNAFRKISKVTSYEVFESSMNAILPRKIAKTNRNV